MTTLSFRRIAALAALGVLAAAPAAAPLADPAPHPGAPRRHRLPPRACAHAGAGRGAVPAALTVDRAGREGAC